MMRRLFILTICAASVGTVYCSPKSATNGWTKEHAAIAKQLQAAEFALENPGEYGFGNTSATNDVGAAIDLLRSMRKLNLNAADETGKTLSVYAAKVIELGGPAGLSGHLHELQAALQGKSMTGN